MPAHFSGIAFDLDRTVAQAKPLLVNTATFIQKHLADRKESHSPSKR